MAERLADERIQRFLAVERVVVLATVEADGAPHAMPMWFLADPDRLTMVSVANLRKLANLHRDPRCCVVAQGGTRSHDIRGVTLWGRAEFPPDSAERRSLAERLVERYHPDLERRWGGRAMPADRVLFRIAPDRVQSWGLTD
jgi:PPOX class probable F420-dependent enzyme